MGQTGVFEERVAARIRHLRLASSGFNPESFRKSVEDEPRDDHGQWTSGDSSWDATRTQAISDATPAEQKDAWYVYYAEDEAETAPNYDPESKTSTPSDGSGRIFGSTEEAQGYADSVLAKYGNPGTKVTVSDIGQSDAHGETVLDQDPHSYTVEMNHNWLDQQVLCHEMSHIIATESSGTLNHGDSFRDAYLRVLGGEMPDLAKSIAPVLQRYPASTKAKTRLAVIARVSSGHGSVSCLRKSQHGAKAYSDDEPRDPDGRWGDGGEVHQALTAWTTPGGSLHPETAKTLSRAIDDGGTRTPYLLRGESRPGTPEDVIAGMSQRVTFPVISASTDEDSAKAYAESGSGTPVVFEMEGGGLGIDTASIADLQTGMTPAGYAENEWVTKGDYTQTLPPIVDPEGFVHVYLRPVSSKQWNPDQPREANGEFGEGGSSLSIKDVATAWKIPTPQLGEGQAKAFKVELASIQSGNPPSTDKGDGVEMAHAFLETVDRESTPSPDELTRGMGLTPDQVKTLFPVGGNVNLPLSSWSADMGQSSKFGAWSALPEENGGIEGRDLVLLHAPEGTMGWNVSNTGTEADKVLDEEKETITGGQFHVNRIETGRSGLFYSGIQATHVYLSQVKYGR